MVREQDIPSPRLVLTPATRRSLLLALWAALICCVIVGSYPPQALR